MFEHFFFIAHHTITTLIILLKITALYFGRFFLKLHSSKTNKPNSLMPTPIYVYYTCATGKIETTTSRFVIHSSAMKPFTAPSFFFPGEGLVIRNHYNTSQIKDNYSCRVKSIQENALERAPQLYMKVRYIRYADLRYGPSEIYLNEKKRKIRIFWL